MKKSKRKIVASILIFAVITIISGSTYGHSGRTDSSGGHRDNQNKSGLGSYHYHCGGNPAHLHTNGVCPYSSSSSSSSSYSKSSSGTSSNSKSTTSTTATEPVKTTNVEVTEVKINEKIEELEIGEKRNLTVTVTPNNATDKVILWKSSDETILSITQKGEIEALKAGTVEVSAIGSNNKSDTVSLTVKEQPKVIENAKDDQNTVATVASTTSDFSSEEGSGAGAGIAALGLLGCAGGISYWAYKKFF